MTQHIHNLITGRDPLCEDWEVERQRCVFITFRLFLVSHSLPFDWTVYVGHHCHYYYDSIVVGIITITLLMSNPHGSDQPTEILILCRTNWTRTHFILHSPHREMTWAFEFGSADFKCEWWWYERVNDLTTVRFAHGHKSVSLDNNTFASATRIRSSPRTRARQAANSSGGSK